jgi:hypothetical protein
MLHLPDEFPIHGSLLFAFIFPLSGFTRREGLLRQPVQIRLFPFSDQGIPRKEEGWGMCNNSPENARETNPS